jgi:hypothetical protein
LRRLDLDDEVTDDCAVIVEFDLDTQTAYISSYTQLSSSAGHDSVLDAYFSVCDLPDPLSLSSSYSDSHSSVSTLSNRILVPPPSVSENVDTFILAKKKYKPVAKKVRSVLAPVPEQFRIVRNILGDPLADMPVLDPNSPSKFTPTSRYTEQCHDITDKSNSGDFLWKGERDLMHDFMKKQDMGFAWNDLQRGKFRTNFFPPVEFPLVPHTPWVQRNIPIPPGIYDDVCKLIQQKMDAGVYEDSNSSYRS